MPPGGPGESPTTFVGLVKEEAHELINGPQIPDTVYLVKVKSTPSGRVGGPGSPTAFPAGIRV